MILNLSVTDNSNRCYGDLSLMIDFESKSWSVYKSDTPLWKKISFSNNGRIEVKDWKVIWLYDALNMHRMIIRDAPISNLDVVSTTGTARLYNPLDFSMTDMVFKWSVDVQATQSSQTQASGPITAVRQRLLDDLQKVLPCSYMDQNYIKITGGLTKQGGGYTTCGSLPGYVSSQLWRYKTGKMADMPTLTRITLNGTNNVRIKGNKFASWIEANLTDRPKSGDVYALLDYGKTDKKVDVIGHVGVIQSSTGNTWKTADLGQGDGYSGKRDVERDYKSASGELYGEHNQGGGYRVLAGWVDLDKYYAAI